MGLLDVLLRKIIKVDGEELIERKTWSMTGATIVDNPVTKETEFTFTSGGESDDGTGNINNSSTGPTANVGTTISSVPVKTIRFTGVAPSVSGFAAGTTARRMIVTAIGGPLVLANEDIGSLPANRILTGTGEDLAIAQNNSAMLVYDATSLRWRPGAVDHKLRAQGNLSVEEDPAGFAGEIHIRPSPPGHYNPHDQQYAGGAVGDGVTPDDAAFAATIAAMNTDAILFGGARAGTMQLADNKTYYFADNLIIERGLCIQGVGGSAINIQASSKFKFAPGKCIWIKGNSGNDVAAATGANLRALGLVFQNVPGITNYAHSHTYAPGALIYLPHDHECVYECLTGGTTMAPPQPIWQAGHGYTAGDLVTPTTPNGHVYKATTGTSDSTEPINWNFAPNSTTTDGGVTWTEQPASAYFLDWADTVLRPGVGITDPSVIWVAGATYQYNSVVRMPGVTTSFFWLGPQSGIPISGTAGAIPLTANPQGTVISDGLLDWTCYDSASFLHTDGAVWMPRLHCGIFITCQCFIEDVNLGGTSGYGVQIQANGGGRPSNNADFWQLSRVTSSLPMNGFIRVRGEDAQAGMAIGCSAYGNFDGVHFHEWDKGFVDLSESGSAWIGCNSQGHSGYSYETYTTVNSTFTGCYAESQTPNRLRNGVVSGGNLCNSPITTDSFAVLLRGAGVGTRNMRGVDDTNYLTSGTITFGMAGVNDGEMPGRMSLAIRAGSETLEQGFTWSNSWPGFYGWPNGWHAWSFGPSVYGPGFVGFAIAGDTSPALRDGIGTAKFLIGKPQFFIGGSQPGDTAGSATIVAWRSALPSTGKWIVGDIVFNLIPSASTPVGWVCLTAGDFAGTPPVFMPFGGTNAPVAMPALAIDWAVGDSFTKTLAGGANALTFSNLIPGKTIIARITGAASTLTYPTIKWAGGAAPTQTATGIDVYTFFYDGTDVFGSVLQAFA